MIKRLTIKNASRPEFAMDFDGQRYPELENAVAQDGIRITPDMCHSKVTITFLVEDVITEGGCDLTAADQGKA